MVPLVQHNQRNVGSWCSAGVVTQWLEFWQLKPVTWVLLQIYETGKIEVATRAGNFT